MISNQEFIKTQAYEISWAVFRCAELFSQGKLRGEVESVAIDLIAESDFPRIEKLTSLIRLAESVGQIATINANVLYRELDNLAKAIRISVAEKQRKGDITASLEQIFTNSAYAESLASDGTRHPELVSGSASKMQIPDQVRNDNNPNPAIRQNNNSQFGSIEHLLSAAVLPNKPIPAPVIPARSAGSGQAPAGIQNSHISATVSTPAGSWQYVILQKVKDLGQTTTKELTASFPEISERTIRFYLQKLVDSGAIDRIGSTGPGSAYKAKEQLISS